jgi:dipeptidyl aminopeptidase/acylaminoacyl peptidase
MNTRAYAAPIMALIVLLAAEACFSAPPNPWTVVSVRESRAGDVPFEEASRYLWPSTDANNVPGPDSLVAHVRTDEKHHAYIELEDLRTGKALPLLKANACLPQWSPDGKHIACSVWKSPRQSGQLTVVDVATRAVILDPGVDGITTKWSPDSRTLLAEGLTYPSQRLMLYTISVPDGRVMALDTNDVSADYEFSWSPDGRWIAFSRPTKVDYEDATLAADLWIADAKTGTTWLVLETPDWIESDPLWITNRTIQVDRVHWDDTEAGVKQSVVIELSKKDSPGKEN